MQRSMKKSSSLIISPFGSQYLLIFIFFAFLCFNGITALKFKDASEKGFLVTKDQRETVTVTEYGQISAVQINDGFNGSYHLQFITLEPNSLFLPVLLHADMVFYVHTGSGSLSWVDEDNTKNEINVKRGDIYKFPSGSLFYIRSSLESAREKLRIYAIFTDSNTDHPQNLFIEPYSTLSDLVLGFDKKVLQSAFQVPQEVLDEITGATKPPAIVHLTSKDKHSADQPDWRAGIIETLIRRGGPSDELNSKKKKKTKTFNILDKKPDFSNCNGWSVAVNNRDFRALRDSEIGVFMVNLTKGSMMGPHWNPRASEIAVVTHGQGMISVVCPSTANEAECKNMRFRVKEGDVFTVPRFHPMAQMAYNNDSLVFMGFSTNARQNHPQFLAGKSSVLRTLDKDILALSFNVPNTTMDQLLGSQVDSIILECVSCAEEEEERMREEIERKKQEEEERKREEEEAKRREEEEKAREREREEEEERRKQEEEEARRREEEAKREEEEAKREEEERQREEEEKRKQEEEEAKRREEEAKEEEEEAKREEEERQARERQEEEEERQRKEEQEREEEEEAQRRQEEKEAQRRQEEEEAQRRREKEREEEERQREREEEERGGGRGGGGGGEEARRVLKKMW